MYPTRQAAADIAHQRQTELLRYADRDRLVRVARAHRPRRQTSPRHRVPFTAGLASPAQLLA